MSELKSAFEIEGFLEGECEIERNQGLFEYKFDLESRVILYKEGAFWEEATSGLDWFLEKKFKKVEPKKKMYIHDYWSIQHLGSYTNTVRTHLNWNEFNLYNVSKRELIKTTEIEE